MTTSDILNPVLEVPVEYRQNNILSQHKVIQNLLAEAQVCILSTGSDKPIGMLSVSTRNRCPCCNGKSEFWYCTECVCNGDFYHSKVKIPERFAEKKIRERRYRQVFSDLEQKIADGEHRRIKKDQLLEQVKQTQERVRLLNHVIHTGREKLKKAQDDKMRIALYTSYMKDNLPEFKKRLLKIQENIDIYNDRIENKRTTLSEMETRLKSLARQRTKELIHSVFPLHKVSSELSCGDSVDEDSDNRDADTVQRLLAEAVQTNYIQGQWIRSTHFTQQQNYHLISTVLPGSGNYADFSSPFSGDELNRKRDAQNICAGLSFLCQIVNILAWYLNVYLPKRIAFREFCEFSHQELNKKPFQALVSRLNANVLCLCISQGLPSRSLHPTRAVSNVMALLESQEADFGRQGNIAYDSTLIDGLEAAWIAGDGSDSDSESEWETVNKFPLSDVPSLALLGYQGAGRGHYRRAGSDDDTGTHSGLISAAASVMSIFRGFTGSPQK